MPIKRAFRPLLVTATLAAAVAATAVGFSTSGATASTPAPHSLNAPGLHAQVAAALTPASACGYHAAIPADSFKGIPVFNAAQAAQPFLVRFVTTQGAITVRMNTSKAPCTTFSFRFLASRGYFNQTHCHRLTTQGIYVLQCGDPTGTGSGGPGYKFANENTAGATYQAGTLAMANSGGNATNGSQFFIVYAHGTLAPSYSVFGIVVKGLDIVRKVAEAGDNNSNPAGGGEPTDKVTIESVKIGSY